LKTYFDKRIPTVMSIDIEGWELRILQDMDFESYPIPVVCLEHGHHPLGLLDEFMISKKYYIKWKASINTIYLRKPC